MVPSRAEADKGHLVMAIASVLIQMYQNDTNSTNV